MENGNEQHVKCQKISDKTFAFSAHEMYSFKQYFNNNRFKIALALDIPIMIFLKYNV